MTSTIDLQDLRTLADRYSAAWVAHDVDAIVALHTPDSRFRSHGRDQAVEGSDALRTEFTEILTRFPHFGVRTHRLLFGQSHWVLDWTLTFRPEGGEQREFGCLDLVEVTAEGLISRKDTYYDLAEATAAMGRTS